MPHRHVALAIALCRSARILGCALLFACSFLILIGCLATNEERWQLYNQDGVLLFARGEYREALEDFDAALKLRPHDPILVYNTAQCYDRIGDVKKAEQFYSSCLHLDAKHGDARLALVSLMYRTNRASDANQMIRDWLIQEPTSADPYVADAWRLRQEKDYPAAQGRLQQALGQDPNSRRAMTEMAILFETLGMKDRAYVMYERILKMEPQQIEIAERFEQLKAQGVKRPLPD